MKHKSQSLQEAKHESERQQSHTESSTHGCFIHLRNQFLCKEHQVVFRTKIKMRCMLLLFLKVLFFFFFLFSWIDNKQLFVVGRSPRQGPGPCSTCIPTWKKIWWASAPGRPQPPKQPGPPPQADRAHPGYRKAGNIGVIADFSLGRLSHPLILFYSHQVIGRFQWGWICAAPGNSLCGGFTCSFLECKASTRLCALEEGNTAQAALSSLLPQFHF